MAREPVTVPPRRDPITLPTRRERNKEPHPLDPVIDMLSELSSAVRAVSNEVQTGVKNITDSVSVLGGRLDGQSRAMQDMTDEIRSFVDDKGRLKGRVIMLEMLEHDRQNGKADDAE